MSDSWLSEAERGGFEPPGRVQLSPEVEKAVDARDLSADPLTGSAARAGYALDVRGQQRPL
jgi:hypothetical protein